MPAILEMMVGLFCFGEREGPIDHRLQAVHLDRAVQCSEIGTASDADRAERNPAPVSDNGSSPVSEGVRLAPIRLTCPPTARAFRDIAIVPGPPISTTQSTPRPSVSSN